MLSVCSLARKLARLQIRRSRSVQVFVFVAITGVLGVPEINAAQLSLSWIDTSAGQAFSSIERKTGTTGTYAEIAQQQPGTVTYTDGSVASATTYCYRVRAFDASGTSSYSNEACASPSGGFDLTVVRGGTGSGSVASTPSGINCGTACSASYPSGTVVTVAATPASGSVFSGWTGGGCSGTDPCTMAGNGSVIMAAAFAATASPTYTLTASKSGPGTVSSSPSGISCGSVCSTNYASGTMVTLTALPANGARFKGWTGGGCSGTGTCTVTLTANVSVSAAFGKGGRK
jgi:hypothetical protein